MPASPGVGPPQWRKPLWVVLLGGGVFLAVEVLFLAANVTKILYGAWVPLLIASPCSPCSPC